MAIGFTAKKVKRINQKKPILKNNDVEKAFPKGSVKATPIKKMKVTATPRKTTTAPNKTKNTKKYIY